LNMYILLVRLSVKKDKVDEFIKESIGDAEGSVRNEPGCRRFDIIQDSTDPTQFAFCEVYDDEEAFKAHTTYEHFKIWAKNTEDFYSAETEVSFCKPVYPNENVIWDSLRENSSDHEYFSNSSLMVIAAPQYVKEENVDEFIDSITLDSIGSTNEEPGCLRFDVYQNVNDPTELYLYEVYSNADAFEYHRGTPHIKNWQETVKDMYDESRKGQNGRRGKNIWPPDNWEWNSGQRK
jgi:autoinducer 2-degrading protein